MEAFRSVPQNRRAKSPEKLAIIRAFAAAHPRFAPARPPAALRTAVQDVVSHFCNAATLDVSEHVIEKLQACMNHDVQFVICGSPQHMMSATCSNVSVDDIYFNLRNGVIDRVHVCMEFHRTFRLATIDGDQPVDIKDVYSDSELESILQGFPAHKLILDYKHLDGVRPHSADVVDAS